MTLLLVRRWLDAWSSGDIETFVAMFDADAEVITDASFPEAGPLRGRETTRNWSEGLKDSWEEDARLARERAMSEANVRIVRRWLKSQTGPKEARANVVEFWDADGDYYPVRKFPEAHPCHGREEIAEFVARFFEAWSVDYEIQQIFEVGDDRVLACATLHTSGRSSQMKLEGDLYFCVWLRHGRFFRVEDHLTLPGALRALGLQGDTLEAAGLRDARPAATRGE
jgi:ketosteroid isomerase-like protein